MTLKMLPLDLWMTLEEDDDLDSRYPKLLHVTAIAFRDGIYRHGRFCWFEHKGVARLYDAKQFDYDLSQLNHKPLHPKDKEAIKRLMLSGLANTKLKNLYHADEEWHMIRDTYRMSLKGCMKVRRKPHARRSKA